MVLVLNKIDLVPSRVVEAWKSYLTGEFPGVNVVGVSSLPEEAGWDYKSKSEMWLWRESWRELER